MPTATTEEAMTLLKRTRADLIQRGRNVARELAAQNGTVTARDVYRAIRNEIPEGVGNFFLGAIFRTADFRWTGEWRMETNDDYQGAMHEPRAIKVWRLA